MNRLDNLKSYLKEARKDPDNNKLYIEDLKESIKTVERYENKEIIIEKGFEIS